MSPALVWFLAGLVLVLLEFAVPGVILVFIGFGAWVASLTTWLGWTTSVGSQTAIFALSSLVLVIALRRLFKTWFMGYAHTADTSANMEEFIDRPVRVVTAITPGNIGKVEFKGASWNASSVDELIPGDTAIIRGRDGLCLIVNRK